MKINGVERFISAFGDNVAQALRPGADDLDAAAAALRTGSIDDAVVAYDRGMDTVMSNMGAILEDTRSMHPGYAEGFDTARRGARVLDATMRTRKGTWGDTNVTVRFSGLRELLDAGTSAEQLATKIDGFTPKARVLADGVEREYLLSRARGLAETADRASYHHGRGWGYFSDYSPYGDYIGSGRGPFNSTGSPDDLMDQAHRLRDRARELAIRIDEAGGDAPREGETVSRIWTSLMQTI